MRLTKTVQIVEMKPQYDRINQKIGEIPIPIKEFRAEIEPYSSKLAEEKYGVSVKVTNRLFCEPVSELKLGSILICEGKKYVVTQLLNFDRHYEVLMELKS